MMAGVILETTIFHFICFSAVEPRDLRIMDVPFINFVILLVYKIFILIIEIRNLETYLTLFLVQLCVVVRSSGIGWVIMRNIKYLNHIKFYLLNEVFVI